MEKQYVVIFHNKLKDHSEKYLKLASEMQSLAEKQNGYIGIQSVRDEDGIGITVSYWDSMESIQNWKANTDHLAAQAYGIKDGYEWYNLTVAEVCYQRSHPLNTNG